MGRQYAENILRVLRNENVFCQYKAEEMLVYAYYESVNGEIFCIFDCSDEDMISSFSICSTPIAKYKQKEIQLLLEKINEDLPSGIFHIDNKTCCIALVNQYPISSQDELKVNDFTFFCQWTYRAFMRYGVKFNSCGVN